MRHELAAAADATVAPDRIGFCAADRIPPQILATPVTVAAAAGATAAGVGVGLGVVGATVAAGGLAVGLVKGDEEQPADPPEASVAPNGDVWSLLRVRAGR